jgi:hypothetical protein
MSKITVEELRAAISAAVHEFGAYSYDDKGPFEVMDVENLVARVQVELTKEEACALLKELASDAGRGYALAEAIWFELPEDYPDPFDDPDVEMEAHPVEVKITDVKKVLEGISRTMKYLD